MLRSIDDVAANLPDVLTYASEREVNVIIGAEPFEYTQDAFSLINTVSTLYSNLGVVIQSNQRRADQDLSFFLNEGNPIRLIKGYGNIKPIDGFTRQEDIDRQFRKQMFELIDTSHEKQFAHSICTHDSVMVDAAKLYLKKQGYGQKEIGFTFLYGVKPDIQQHTLQLGHSVTISVPYGENWYPYFSHQIGDKPG
jgi:proline dehydrogenase